MHKRRPVAFGSGAGSLVAVKNRLSRPRPGARVGYIELPTVPRSHVTIYRLVIYNQQRGPALERLILSSLW